MISQRKLLIGMEGSDGKYQKVDGWMGNREREVTPTEEKREHKNPRTGH